MTPASRPSNRGRKYATEAERVAAKRRSSAKYREKKRRQSLGLEDNVLASSLESRKNSGVSPHCDGPDPHSPPAMSTTVSTLNTSASLSLAFTDSTRTPNEDSPWPETNQTRTPESRASITADDCSTLADGRKTRRSSARKWVRKDEPRGRMIAHSNMELNGQQSEAKTIPLSDAWKLLERQGKKAYRKKRKRWIVNERSVKRDAWREAIEDARNLERARRTTSEDTIESHVNVISTWLQAISWPKWTYYPNDGHAIYVKMIMPRILAIVHSAIRSTANFAERYRALLALTHVLLHLCRYSESGVGRQVMQCYSSGVMHEKGNLQSKYMRTTSFNRRSRDVIADGMLAILEKVDDGGSNIKWLKEEGGAADLLRQEMRGVYWLLEEHMPKNARSGMAFVCIYLEL